MIGPAQDLFYISRRDTLHVVLMFDAFEDSTSLLLRKDKEEFHRRRKQQNIPWQQQHSDEVERTFLPTDQRPHFSEDCAVKTIFLFRSSGH